MSIITRLPFELDLDGAALAYIDDLASTLDTDWSTALSVLLNMSGAEFLREQKRKRRRRSPQPAAPVALRLVPTTIEQKG